MPDVNRRTFLAVAAAACACGACPFAALGADKGKGKAAADPVEVGTPADFGRVGAYDKFAEEHGFFLVREKRKLFAVGASCTHKATRLKLKDDAFACPKHGARFTLQGKVTKAPAKRPLPRFAISLGESGKITVDPAKTFDQDHWNDEGSYLPVSD
jgi:cytochrome b6-f complex iron-sulfur subunit